MARAHIHVTGIVQGVGMRPFVYREALAHGIRGWVLNAGDGVHIEASGTDAAIASFAAALRDHAPAASRIETVEVRELDDAPADEPGDTPFRIVASEDDTARTTLVSPDIATCDDCLRELFDPSDRRFHYPFINCTNCGPRFTIIQSLPYDRAATSMQAFPMCPACAGEYANPGDRRFHAQPDACFACGPHITWREAPTDRLPSPRPTPRPTAAPVVGRTRVESDAIIERCAELIASGGIVALKGLGGFHLACDAANEHAVATLRSRKHRPGKPLAVMVRDLAAASLVCNASEEERALLAGSVRPIVLLRQKRDAVDAIAPNVAGDCADLGVMLPYTPLQHLIMAACRERGVNALVMTSGNVSGAPIERDDAAAWERLVASGIADALLGNDRAILTRYDDSVMRLDGGDERPVRRARGYAPQPLPLPPSATRHEGDGDAADEGHPSELVSRRGTPSPPPAVLACGPEQKATLAFTREHSDGTASCFISQHIGDLENAETLDAWHEARRRLSQLFDLAPQALACDLHPSYLSSQWARSTARSEHLPLVEVQHHHAHVASVIADAAARGLHDASLPVLGIAFDGTGAGTDGTIWGGEFLFADLAGFSRVGALAPWPLPGGAASVRDPRRCALALLQANGLLDHPGASMLLGDLDAATRSITARMVERRINCPLTSSMGRLFDAVAALLGIRGEVSYEGEAAIALEAAAWRALARIGGPTGADTPVPIALPAFSSTWSTASTGGDDGRPSPAWGARPSPDGRTGERPASRRLVLDPAPTLRALLDARAAGASPDDLALAFHHAAARSTRGAALALCRELGIRDVALTGGVFMNRLLFDLVRTGLETDGATVLAPTSIPANDGCISYGQAAVARARLSAR